MLTLETTADIQDDGTLKVRVPEPAPKGPRRVVIVIDDSEEKGSSPRRRLPDLSEFRAELSGQPYPGNSVVDMRDEER